MSIKILATDKPSVFSTSFFFDIKKLIFTFSFVIVKIAGFTNEKNTVKSKKYAPVQIIFTHSESDSYHEFLMAVYFFIGLSVSVGIKKT